MKISQLTLKDISEIRKDSKKFELVVQENMGFLRKITNKIVENNQMDETDIIQEAVIALWKAINKYKFNQNDRSWKPTSFSTYSYTVITNHFKKLYKRFKTKNPIEHTFSQFTKEDADFCIENFIVNIDENFTENLIEKINLETEIDKEIDVIEYNMLVMKHVLCMNFKEIGREIKMDEAKVKNYFYRILKPKLDHIMRKYKTNEEEIIKAYESKAI